MKEPWATFALVLGAIAVFGVIALALIGALCLFERAA